MTVLRRLDAVLEPTKQAVLDRKKLLDQADITNQDGPLRDAAGQAFYNISKFTLRVVRARASQQQLRLGAGEVQDHIEGKGLVVGLCRTTETLVDFGTGHSGIFG
jgi:type I restriction-modification system DNA methylase subunit